MSFILLLLFFQNLPNFSGAREVARTPYGDIAGFSYTTATGKPGRVFLGIKYGFGPRFKKPFPITYYGNVDATRFGPLCPQIDGRAEAKKLGTTVSDDCLSLNIYAPPDVPGIVPVLFWIHGGQLQTGNGNLDPEVVIERFVSRGIIVVTVQYRLGFLGFLNVKNLLPDDFQNTTNFDANVGAHDVLLALNWLKKNIESFGGDPDAITVAGHSAGASIASCLYLSGKADGLISRLILASGTSESAFDGSWGYRDVSAKLIKSATYTDIHAKNLTKSELEEVESYMEYREIDDVLEHFDQKNFLGWPLVVDGELFKDIPKVMAENFNASLNSSRPLEVFLGVTRDEWAAFELKLMLDGVKALDPAIYNWRMVVKFVSKILAFAFPRPEITSKMRKMVDGYGFSAMNPNVSSWVETTIDVLTDAFFASRAIREALYYQKLGANVYLYEFTQPASSFLIDGYKPVLHGDDLSLLFGRKGGMAGREMARLWTDFVRGVPPATEPLDTSRWNYVEIDDEGVTERRDFRRNARTLWGLRDDPLYIDFPKEALEKGWQHPTLTLF